MFRVRKSLFILLIIFALMIFGGIFMPSGSGAQYWEILPPYNVLWPLYSPALSPINPLTGLATPLVTELTANTILPVQPGIAWDPSQDMYWLLYNTPPPFVGGLLWYDWRYGLNPWPPNYLRDPLTGAPIPITYAILDPTVLTPPEGEHFEWYIPSGNAAWAVSFGITGQPYLDLLTPAQLFGLPPILPY